MTFHVAMAAAPGAVLVSDSQGSTATGEIHGFQKQFVGDDYLLGAAGNMAVIELLLRELASGSRVNGNAPPTGLNVEQVVQDFLVSQVRPDMFGAIEVLLVAPSASGYSVKTFYPRLFTRFGHEAPFGMIGSGSEFAQHALLRDDQLGLSPVAQDLTDLFLATESLANVANESLTVDDQLLVGFLANGRSYICGHAGVRAALIPPALQNHWLAVGQAFNELISLSQALRGELRTVRSWFSTIRLGPLPADIQHQIELGAVGLQMTRLSLVNRIDEYFGWYDTILGR